jgi:hypothetical protein
MTVDRDNRDRLVAAINRYLDGQTTAFQFDDEIFGIASDDPTVRHIVGAMWHFYDDCKDHKVQLSKEAWDYFPRLILVLQSDGHIEVGKRRRWGYTQLVALAALLLFVYGAGWLGLGMQLLVLSLPFGMVSIAISSWRSRRAARKADTNRLCLAPFSSFSELIALRRKVWRFRKPQYPAGMEPFNIRTPFENARGWLQLYAAWMFFSPLVLFFQALPITETRDPHHKLIAAKTRILARSRHDDRLFQYAQFPCLTGRRFRAWRQNCHLGMKRSIRVTKRLPASILTGTP